MPRCSWASCSRPLPLPFAIPSSPAPTHKHAHFPLLHTHTHSHLHSALAIVRPCLSKPLTLRRGPSRGFHITAVNCRHLSSHRRPQGDSQPAVLINSSLSFHSVVRVPLAAPNVPASPSSCRAHPGRSKRLIFRCSRWVRCSPALPAASIPQLLCNASDQTVSWLSQSPLPTSHPMQGIHLSIWLTAYPKL
jgi:hypothetical protein